MGVNLSEALIRITENVRSGITEHALASRPAECCGLLSGADGVITDLHPLRNEADKPETRYFASPEDLFAAMRHIREAGHALLGVYHSHPRTHAYPSPSDVEMAFYPEAAYFIVALQPEIELRAFRLHDAMIDEIALTVTSKDAG